MHDPNENRPGYKKTKVGWIPVEWECKHLGKSVSIKTGFAFQSKYYTDKPKHIRLLRGDNIVPGGIRWRDVKRWAQNDADNLQD